MTGNGSKTLRRYQLRSTSGSYWGATIVIADDGYFSTVSCFGNYGFYWSAAGDCFRSFLTHIEPDYLCGKLGSSDEYQGDETERNIKRRIVELRRQGSLTREQARHEWDLARRADLDAREGFALWYQDTSLEDAHELFEANYPLQLRTFCQTVLPALKTALRVELAREKETVPC